MVFSCFFLKPSLLNIFNGNISLAKWWFWSISVSWSDMLRCCAGLVLSTSELMLEDWRYQTLDCVSWPLCIRHIAVSDGKEHHHQVVWDCFCILFHKWNLWLRLKCDYCTALLWSICSFWLSLLSEPGSLFFLFSFVAWGCGIIHAHTELTVTHWTEQNQKMYIYELHLC